MKLFNRCEKCGKRVLVILGIDMILPDGFEFHFCSDKCYTAFLSDNFPYIILDFKEIGKK